MRSEECNCAVVSEVLYIVQKLYMNKRQYNRKLHLNLDLALNEVSGSHHDYCLARWKLMGCIELIDVSDVSLQKIYRIFCSLYLMVEAQSQ